MSTLAIESNATLPRLSHVVSRLEERGFVRRLPAPEDACQFDAADWLPLEEAIAYELPEVLLAKTL